MAPASALPCHEIIISIHIEDHIFSLLGSVISSRAYIQLAVHKTHGSCLPACILQQVLIEDGTGEKILLMAFMVYYFRDMVHRGGIYRSILVLIQTIVNQVVSYLINDSIHDL